jgi:hypothetical protein
VSIIDLIRKAVREGHYEFTDHAIEEMQVDSLFFEEVIDVLLHGDLDSTYTDDPRGPRYVVRGDVARYEVDVVCRLRSNGSVLIIITVYIVD